ncbi:hypothetical protein AWC01_09830 [Mycobacterium doricum]|uniref:Oxidoreductase n=1 Tax=Mycolicibacterium doricum TaxID=126673 RepID=A0A1X1T9Y6_9MYCO|nr:hypothetical protein AWC01_09830 [Mycolicibacterium doricum]
MAMAGTDGNDVAAYEDWPTALSNAEPNRTIVVVAVPPHQHFAPVVAALRQGFHTLCEKPLARTVAEASEMVDEGERAHVMLAECSSRYLGPVTGQFRQLLSDGVIGRPYRLDFVARKARARPAIDDNLAPHWRLSRELSGGGSLWGHGEYDLAMLNRILPAPKEVVVAGAFSEQINTDWSPPASVTYDVESTAGATLTYVYESSRPIVVQWHRTAGLHGDSETYIRVEGTEGSLLWDWTTSPEQMLQFTDEANHVVRRTLPVRPRPMPPNWYPFALLAEDLKDITDSNGSHTPRSVTGQEAIHSLRIMRSMYDVAASGAPAVVEWPDLHELTWADVSSSLGM